MNIKKLFFTKYNEGLLNVWLLILRIIAGAFMLTHGLAKFELLISGQEIMFPDPVRITSYNVCYTKLLR